MKKVIGVFALIAINTTVLWAQTDSVSTEELSNVQSFTPSKLLKKGQVDVQLFNNLYTQTAGRGNDRKLVQNSTRDTYFRTFAQLLVGTSESARVNWGMDLVFSSVRIDSDPKSAALKVLQFGNSAETAVQTRTAFTAIGPKVKFSPFKNHPDFSIQSALWIPLAKDSESDASVKPWIDWNRITSWTQLFYSQNLNSKWQLFYEFDLLARIGLSEGFYEQSVGIAGIKKGVLLSTPMSFFANYFSSDKSTVYAMVQYAPTFGLAPSVAYNGDYFQAGLGGKYQLTDYLQLELLYSNFFLSQNNGAGNTYNVGLRYIR